MVESRESDAGSFAIASVLVVKTGQAAAKPALGRGTGFQLLLISSGRDGCEACPYQTLGLDILSCIDSHGCVISVTQAL